MFITFEGLDFSGKSTQVALFTERLSRAGSQHLDIRDPGGTAIGERIRSILLDRAVLNMSEVTELFLFSASRAQLVNEIIKPNLDRGTIVVCDRFYDSTTAYQGLGRGLPLDAIATINRSAAGGLVPDVTFFIDIPVSEVERRMIQHKTGADRMEMSGRAFYERVRQGYLQLASEAPRFEVLDGLMGIQDIHERVWKRFESVMSLQQSRS
ncbi:MAG TPA: dTMP kinase [Bacteroidetes bacterium]|nr:dTMP kinase [Bacteroidota bacterium]